ncbi:MAG: RluA family pseudouridine synthase [Clostridiales bacterium]|nr:RluA family pseudouridine synthase [Clostridiales bacterium]
MTGTMTEEAKGYAAAAVRTVSWTVQTADFTGNRPVQERKDSDIACLSRQEDMQEKISGGINRTQVRVKKENDRLLTIERFLREKGCSHHVLTLLKRTDHGILKNGVWAYTNQPVMVGDEITVRVEETESSEQILPVPLPLSVVYEDEDVLVVDKPCDMPVHPSMGNHENTLANAVMYYYAERDRRFVFRCITRLDRDTTGLVLIAKNSLSGAILSQQSSRRQIHREYLAITEGVLSKEGTIDAPIARWQDSPLMRCVDFEHGERAVTHYQRLGVYRMPPETCEETFQNRFLSQTESEAGAEGRVPNVVSLANVRLETGRTHQIRVHMKFIGHPLPGDFLYNPDSVCELAPRQMLHAHRLTFTHPVTGETLVFESKMPPDMRRLLGMHNISETENGTAN